MFDWLVLVGTRNGEVVGWANATRLKLPMAPETPVLVMTEVTVFQPNELMLVLLKVPWYCHTMSCKRPISTVPKSLFVK